MKRGHMASLALLVTILASACTPNEPTPDRFTPLPLTVITFGAPEHERQRYEPLITNFNQQNVDIQVDFAPLPETLSLEQVAQRADTALVNGTPNEGAMNLLRDLAPYIDADATFNRSDFVPASLPTGSTPIYS